MAAPTTAARVKKTLAKPWSRPNLALTVRGEPLEVRQVRMSLVGIQGVPMQTATGSKFLPDRELMSKWPPMFHVSCPKYARRNMTASFLCLSAIFVAASSVGTADTIQLPRARPEIVPGRRSPTPEIVVPPSPCQLRLAELAVFEPLSPIMGPGECIATDVVKVDAVLLPDKHRVVFSPPVTLRCPGRPGNSRCHLCATVPTSAAIGHFAVDW
jgi:hypothetical protein